MTRACIATLLLFLASGTAGRAQTLDGLAIKIETVVVSLDGGAQPTTTAGIVPAVLGKASTVVIPRMCRRRAGASDVDAFLGWEASVTPTRIAGEAVSFRVTWSRRGSGSQMGSAASAVLDSTLRPGQVMPVDLVLLDPATNAPGCDARALILQAAVIRTPSPDLDTRVMATDMWLVDRAPDGTERVQQLSLRSRPNESVPFFFDALIADDMSLIFDGVVSIEFVPERREDLRIRFTLRKHILRPGSGAPAIGQASWGQLAPTQLVKPDQVVRFDVLPLADNNAGKLNDHTFSIRFRTRQIR